MSSYAWMSLMRRVPVLGAAVLLAVLSASAQSSISPNESSSASYQIAAFDNDAVSVSLFPAPAAGGAGNAQAGAARHSLFSLGNIAAEAGVSVRVLYRHFEGKDDLLVALIEESQIVFARMIERATADIADPLERLGEALYFATTDAPQRTDENFGRAMARFTVQTSITSPRQVGAAHRPVILVLAGMVRDAMQSEQIETGDAELAASNLYNAYEAHQRYVHLGNSLGGPLASSRELIRFCLLGLGAHIPPGWEKKLGQQKRGHPSAASDA